MRRHRERVAKVRRRNIILESNCWRWYAAPSFRGTFQHHWTLLGKQLMTESGHKHWRKTMMVAPDRAKEHHSLRLIMKGVDQDHLRWPTHRDHWVYYW